MILHSVTRPPHVCVNEVLVRPTGQAPRPGAAPCAALGQRDRRGARLEVVEAATFTRTLTMFHGRRPRVGGWHASTRRRRRRMWSPRRRLDPSRLPRGSASWNSCLSASRSRKRSGARGDVHEELTLGPPARHSQIVRSSQLFGGGESWGPRTSTARATRRVRAARTPLCRACRSRPGRAARSA